ncbi:S-layer homology domain-containing protein [Paenibacillus sp. SC116]|uniref:S-layer homology domain-containing protein n=1 Tax=Paenibacillus sp. SC116 TaxID=2968986 RepID=UPI00215A8F69|nr:S-layer homology domain-containing protein [Paenibacillus sp. SC116]MCR8843931.1 S-layer homology domain-containing protein [Paenibacillus sp. SC116]
MPQQYPFGTSNDKYKTKLFVDTGHQYIQVKCKLIEPYSPPTPIPMMKEIKMINAPSHFHQMGISSYRTKMTLLFTNKQDYVDYLAFCGWTHKFYDERGAIYLGSLEAMAPIAEEANTKYVVEVSLVLIKKDSFDERDRFEFQDLKDDHGKDHWARQNIEEMANLGLITVVQKDGSPVLYFKPNMYITRAEYIVFLNRTRRFIERVLRE